MGRIVPFYAADQGICDQLTEMIRKLDEHIIQLTGSYHPMKDAGLTEGENKMLNRITKPEPWEDDDTVNQQG